jgi:hypothetical protein
MQLTQRGRNGIKLMFLGLLPVFFWVAWFNTRSWCVLDNSFPLSQGSHFSTGEFTVNMNDRYWVQIQSGGKLFPPELLKCPLGSQFTPENVCEVTPELKTHWTLSSEGKTIEGNTDERVKVGRYLWISILGYFRLQRGKHYKLDVYVLSDSSSLSVTKPHLYFGADDDGYMFGQILTNLLEIVGGTVAAIGAFLLISSFVAQRRAGQVTSS